MPVRNCIVHAIDKKPDGSPSILHAASAALPASDAIDTLMSDLNESYNAKPGKAWGFFHEESGAYPLSGWLKKYLDGATSFVEFTNEAAEHLQRLMEESNLTVGGSVIFTHYQQGMTDYLAIAVLQHIESVRIDENLQVVKSRSIDFSHLHLAARINISEWVNNPASKQYISFIKAKTGKKITGYFRDFIGCQEGIDSPSETRTLLKAFSDFIESEDLPEAHAKAKTDALVGYASAQAKTGQPISLQELSELIDEDRPKAFYDHIRNKDYGLSPEIPAHKRTINQFRRFTGRADGISISFEARMLGSKVEFDKASSTLTIRDLPAQLTEQLKRAASA